MERQARRDRTAAERADRQAALTAEAGAVEVLPPGECAPPGRAAFARSGGPPSSRIGPRPIQLGGVYPFLAEAGLGANGVYVGTDSCSGSAAFVF